MSRRVPRHVLLTLAFAAVIGCALALLFVSDARAQQDTTAPMVIISPPNGTTVTDDFITMTFTEPVYSDTSSTEFTKARIRELVTLKEDGPTGDDIRVAWVGVSNDNRTISVLPDTRAKTVYFAFTGDYYDAAGNQGAAASSTFHVIEPPPPSKSVVVSDSSLTLYEAGGGGYLSVKLGKQPTGDVTVTINSSSGANASGADCANTNKVCIDTDDGPDRTNDPLVFTTSNWDYLQWIQLATHDDDDSRIERLTFTLDPSGADYNDAVSATVAITVMDDEIKRAGASTETLELAEGGAGTISVRLSKQPTGTVSVALTSSNSDVTMVPSTLSFTTSNWNTTQLVTVSSTADVNTTDETVYLTLKPSGADYGSARSFTVEVKVKDNGVSGVIVSESALTLNESGSGNTDTFTVKLASNPSSDVRVAVGVWGTGGKRVATADKGILKFTSENGTTAQTVTITGVVDSDDSDDTGKVRLVASQAGPFAGVREELTLAVTDTWDRPDIFVAPQVTSIAEGSSGTYSVSLSSEPTGPVTVWMERSSAIPLVASPTTLTFTTTNYATPQTFTLHAGEIATAAERLYFDFRAEGGGYDGVKSDIYGVWVTGNTANSKRIEVKLDGSDLHRVTADSTVLQAKVKLSAQPSGNVTVSAASSPSGEVTLSIADNGVFTTQNWNTEKNLQININGDADALDERVLVTLTASGSDYGGKKRYFEIVKEDRDLKESEKAPSVTIGDAGLNNVTTVTFSKAVGTCSTKTQTSAAERVCSGSVSAFTSTTVDDVFELVVGRFDQDPVSDVAAGMRVGAPVTFTATISGNVVTITPTGITQTDTDIPLTGNVTAVNLLVKDRYWSVNGGVIGPSVLKRLELQSVQVGNSPPLPDNSDTDNPPPPPVLNGLQLLFTPVVDASDFVGQVIEIRHDNGRTVGCLDVTWANATNGQNVQTWECNGTDAQKWRLEERSEGDHAGRYRLVSALAGGETYCLDNRGDFSDSDRMGIWSCVADTHHAVPNQTFDLTASDDGWTFTFTRDSDSVVMWSERGISWSRGNVGQRDGGTGNAAVWSIVTE